MEELWQHRNEVKHDPPKEQPKFSEKKNLSPEELEQLGHVKCNACGKILPSKRLLRRHFYSDHRELMPDPICAVCGTEFKTRELLDHTHASFLISLPTFSFVVLLDIYISVT